MLGRINRYLARYNSVPLNPSSWNFLNFKAHKDQPQHKIDEDKTKTGIDYDISQDAQIKIKDINGKNITPIDVNPWNQNQNINEKENEPKNDIENVEPKPPVASVPNV